MTITYTWRFFTPLIRVLVVDDERAVREALRRALGLEGYSVDVAGVGSEALVMLVETLVAVVLDVMMPKMDGLEVARALREAGDQTRHQ